MQIQVIEYLRSKGANFDDFGTFLWYAINIGNVLLVQYAIQHGVDVNQPICEAYTPLSLAIQIEHSEMVKYLIQNGADVTICDQNRNMEYELVRSVINSIEIKSMMETID